MVAARQAMDDLLAGHWQRPVIAPFIERLAARIAGVSYEAMTQDAGRWTAALSKAATLLDVDAVIVGGDITLLAEALGGPLEWRDDRPVLIAPPPALDNQLRDSGRLSTAIETADRLFQSLRKTHGCIAAMPGPITLASQAFGGRGCADDPGPLKSALVSVAEAYCKTRPDILLLIEKEPISAGLNAPRLRRLYGALKNIAAYYDVRLALYVEDYSPADFPALRALNADLYVLAATANSLAADPGRTGLGEPGLLIPSAGEVPADADLERLRDLLDRLKARPVHEKGDFR